MKVIFIEGLPGSGKTTFARKLKEFYVRQGKSVSMFQEGDLHPIDVAWCSIADNVTYHNLISKYSRYEEEIRKQTREWNNQFITAYTKISVHDQDQVFYNDFGKHEIYNREDYDYFRSFHIELWKSFNPISEIYIFECVFLQNHINELILKYNLSETQIVEYFKDLISCLTGEIHLYYIKQEQIDEQIARIANERKSDNPYSKDWIALVIEYFENAKYSRELNYIGYDGALRYFKDRQKIELKVLSELPIDTHIFELVDDYDSIFTQMTDIK